MLKKKDRYVIAVVGATGAVGREIIEILEQRDFPVGELRALASEDSAGERLEFQGKGITVRALTKDACTGADIVFFSAGADLSIENAPAAVKAGAVVIDATGAFSMDPNVPLVVPEVNAHAMTGQNGIIACPNSSTAGMVAALKPIHDAAKIRRLVVTTLQSVSGSGRKAMDELAGQTVALLNFRDVEAKVYPRQIAFNCLPHIDAFLDDGSTEDEMRTVRETKKILEADSLRMTATAVRVPVFRCHSATVNIETEKKLSANEVRALLATAPGILVYDDPQKNIYPLAIEVAGRDEVYVGRIREDESVPSGVNLWLVSDNLRKGSALNTVQIAEYLLKQ